MRNNGLPFRPGPLLSILLGIFALGFSEGAAFVFKRDIGTTPTARRIFRNPSIFPHVEPSWTLHSTSTSLQESPQDLTKDQSQFDSLFQELYESVDLYPSGLVRLQTSVNEKDGTAVRGVYLNSPVKKGEAILTIPLSACLRDDEPPAWLDCDLLSPNEPGDPCLIAGYYNPSDWATRLAASFLDLKLQKLHSIDKISDLWLSLLPNADFLRASLPIHWSPRILQSASNTALELAVDSAFFARAEAIQELMEGLKRNSPPEAQSLSESELHRMCENALDVVQTRSCRVALSPGTDANGQSNELSPDWLPPLRLLAPVFDFINHPSTGKANSEFVVDIAGDDEDVLVVRALRDLEEDEEVLIDYGDAARPAWKCLASYGFVPTFSQEDEAGPEDDDRGLFHVAEVYLDGVRYEVGAETVPEDIVAACSANGSSFDDVVLTPDIAIRLSRRLSDVAYQLLIDPLHRYRDNDAEGKEASLGETAEDILSAQLAASLRWNQHRILLACSLGLQDWAILQNDGSQSKDNSDVHVDTSSEASP